MRELFRKETLWKKLEIPLWWLEDLSDALVETLEKYDICCVGQVATLTEAELLERTECLGGLDHKQAGEDMYRLTVVLADMGLMWGMKPEDVYGWMPPSEDRAHA